MELFFGSFKPDADDVRLLGFLEKLSDETNRNWTNHFGQGSASEVLENIIHAKDHKIYVAHHMGEIVAVGHLHNFVGDECYLGMAVRDDKQRSGIGSMLLEYLMKQASNLNIKTVFLHVYADNVPALRLYEKHGFQYCAEITDQTGRKRYAMFRFVEPKK